MFTRSIYRIAPLTILGSCLLAACWGSGGSNSTGSTGANPPGATSFTIGGTVAGLGAGESAVLHNNGGNDLTVNGSGPFTFSTQLANGAAYAVTVATHPTGKACSVSAGNGTVSNANVTSVQVACVGLLQITTASLANGVQGVNYTQPIGATGGLAPYNFALGNGQLPPGLALGANGLTGVPTIGGNFAFEVQARDAATPSQTATSAYRVWILEITTKSAADGTRGQPYNQALTVTGERGNVTWALAPGSALPPGLSIPAGTATIQGTPTQGGAYTFDLQATDADSPTRTHTQRLTIRVLEITTTALPDGIQNQAYNQRLAVVGDVGATTWALAQGPLPPGLALTGNGTIAGTPTETGTFQFSVRVTDSGAPARTYTRILSINIDSPVPAAFEVVNVLEDGTPENNIYLNNRLLPSTKQYSISGNGRFVAFTTASGRVLLRDTCRGSAPAGCVPATTAMSAPPTNDRRVAFSPAISADGRFVAYRSTSANEDPAFPSPNNGSAQFYVRDNCIGGTGTCFQSPLLIPERFDNIPGLPRGVQFPGAIGPAISADGRFILFSVISDPGLAPELTTTGQPAILVHDRDSDGNGIYDEGGGGTRNHVVSYRPGSGRTLFGDDPSVNDFPTEATLSGDGNQVAMVSTRPGQSSLVYVTDRRVGVTLDLADLAPRHPLMRQLSQPDMSFDGSIVAVVSSDMTLEHVFRGDLVESQTIPITSAVTSGGAMSLQPPSLSESGRFLAFDHFSDELGVGNSLRTYDVFVWDECREGSSPCVPLLRCLTGVLPDGTPTTAGSGSPRLSADGSHVVFISADPLDPNVPTTAGFQRIYIAPTGVRE